MMRRRRRTPPPQPPAGGGRITRRRKLEQLEPPPVDVISTLPDDLLGEIISLLPLKDGARTQILAPRWRDLWPSAPLNLDCRGDDSFDVSRVLNAHTGPTRRFCVRRMTFHIAAVVIRWLIRSAALDCLQELELEFARHTMEWLPSSVFECSSRTLCALTLARCKLFLDPTGLHFPHLKLLGLECVRIPDDSLQSFVDGCPALEILLVHTSPGFRRLRINSLTLTTICVRINDPDPYSAQPQTHSEELVIESAPRLERLIVHLYAISDLDVSIFSAPKVETLDILADWHNFYTRLVSCSRVMQKLPGDDSIQAIHTVKSLAVNMDHLSLDNVVDLMRLFPCLEKLYVKSRAWSGSNCWRRKHRNLHEIRLKTIVLEPYLGNMSHVNMAKFFILNARVMESMTFHINAKLNNDKFFAE